MRKEKLEELREYIEELKTIKLLKSTVINNGFLSINYVKCILNNGMTINREEILKNSRPGNAAIILPLTREYNVILIVEPRVLSYRTVGIGLPAGYIEEYEEPVKAALRELVEETGYIPTDIIEIAKYYQDQGCSRAYNHSFIANNCEKKSNQKLDKDEFIRYFECTYQEALELMEMRYINDANSMLTLEKSKYYVKER